MEHNHENTNQPNLETTNPITNPEMHLNADTGRQQTDSIYEPAPDETLLPDSGKLSKLEKVSELYNKVAMLISSEEAEEEQNKAQGAANNDVQLVTYHAPEVKEQPQDTGQVVIDHQQPEDDSADNYQRSIKWNTLHATILKAMGDLIRLKQTMPSHADIAEWTGVHRNTVRAHLRDYENSPLYKSQLEQYQFAAPTVIDGIMVRALDGDTRAAKVYLDALPKIRSWQVGGKKQGGCVLIKDVQLKQEDLDKCPDHILDELQRYIQNLLPAYT